MSFGGSKISKPQSASPKSISDYEKQREQKRKAVFDKLKKRYQGCGDEELMNNVPYFSSPKKLRITLEELPQREEDWGKVYIPFKLVLTHMSLSPLFKMSGRIMDRVGIASFKYGLVHAGIQIGPYMFDWNDSSLCIPYLFSGREDTVVAIDMEWMKKSSVTFKDLEKICEVCVQWNVNESYDVGNKNCQHFTDAILKALGIDKPIFEGALGEFMTKIQKSNKLEGLEFEFKGRKYATHEELDSALYELESSLTEEDKRLLKLYDRVFWYQYFAVSKESNLPPDMQQLMLGKCKPSSATSCYFKNPLDTGTLIGNAFDQGGKFEKGEESKARSGGHGKAEKCCIT